MDHAKDCGCYSCRLKIAGELHDFRLITTSQQYMAVIESGVLESSND